MRFKWLLLGMITLLSGCSGPNLNMGTGDCSVGIYDGGKFESDGDLDRSAESVKELNNLLHDPAVQWKPSFVTYAPSLYFRTATAEVFLQPTFIILESDDGDGKGRSQWTAPIATPEYQKIRTLVEQEMASKAGERTPETASP